ncbi:hypothetical protein DBR06_SOUSAS33710059, partial [Sousa chinensis]
SNFCTEATGFSHLFPHLQPHLLTLPCWFQLPVFRDYIMCAGEESAASQEPQCLLSPPNCPPPPACGHLVPPLLTFPEPCALFSGRIRRQVPQPPPSLAGSVPSDKASASYLLSLPGVLLAVGGPLEAWEAKPGALSLRIRNQKRFVKLALEEDSAAREGAQRAPGGLIQQFPNPPGSWVRRTQEALQPLLRMALPLFHGPRGLLLPFRTPIHTRTPRPSRAQVDAQHEVYLERLKQLLKEHMARSGVPADRHLPPP